MALRSGRRTERHLAPLLLLVAFVAMEAAAAQSPREKAYRDARMMVERDVPGALAAADAALQAAGNAEDEWTWALRVLRAELLAQTGKPNDARAILTPPLPRRFATSEAEVRRVLALAMLAAGAHDSASARARFTEALDLATAHRPELVPEVLIVAGRVGNDREKEGNLRRGMALARKRGNAAAEVKNTAALQFLLTEQSRFPEAIFLGEKVLDRARQLEFARTVTSLETNLGWAYISIGDLDGALDLFVASEAEAAKQDLTAPRIVALTQQGTIFFMRRDLATAVARLTKALELARTTADASLDDVLRILTAVALERKDYAQARLLLEEARRQKMTPDETLRLRILQARTALPAEPRTAERILKEVEQQAAQSTKWEAQGRLAEVYVALRDPVRAETKFRESMATAVEARSKIPAKEVNLRLSFMTVFADLFASYLDFLVAANRIDDALAATEAHRARTLEEGLELDASAAALDARGLARKTNATILCYWLGPKVSYLWIVRPGGVELKKLPADTVLNAEADAYQRALLGRQGTLAATASKGQKLYQLLVQPANIPKNSRVIVAPDGRLHALNFETLVVPGTPPHYWIEDVTLMTAGSLQLLARAPKKPTPAPSLLLVGNPPQPDPAFPNLPHAGKEVESVGRQFAKKTVLEKQRATPSQYQAAGPGAFDYLHFVAHGVTAQKPLDSAIILGSDASKSYRLVAAEIIKTPLQARLVTISSCHGAGARTYAGEGLVGLAWAFLRAGADEVVAALWEVNDAATPGLMEAMYRSIRKGQDPASALREAKLSLLRSDSIHRKASYWAPFVLYSGR
ncbi:MAG TPA: CHAT domain-containing protein [Thermoanaerobaculia bacterium]|nr:CHAT domain-containing protein [Thermoanaerobaculia bacterium]